jgi:hypothetical protein
MLTLFSVPKPFAGHIDVIQRNALASWKRLPGVEVVLFGDEPGTADVAREVGALHVPEVAVNEFGTPLLDSVFAQAQAVSESPRLAYVNGDVILLRDFTQALARVSFERFLVVGRRWNVKISEPLDFDRADVEEMLRARLAAEGVLDPPTGIDYFVFDRLGPLAELLPFAVGRPAWDNWMIYNARRRGIPVVDATRAVTAIHQMHRHDHVPAKREGAWFGPESDANYALIGEVPHFRTYHATHVLTRRGVHPALTPTYFRHRWRTRHLVEGRFERAVRRADPVVAATRPLRRALRRLRRA